MEIKSTKNRLATQQLVRYEALFKLLDDIQGLENIGLLSSRVAAQWKYFANVSSWRIVIFHAHRFFVIDGFRGEATVNEEISLSAWDAYNRSLERPRSLRMADPIVDGPQPPSHLNGKRIGEIRVLPLMRGTQWIALLSVASRDIPFSELDARFIRIFGHHFADRLSDILLRRQATEALIRKASHDALTDLYNRGAIIERLQECWALSKRTKQSLSVILADIDFFKVINDRHGHLTGDAVLRGVSRRLKTQLRESDNLGRYGGEEFLFVLFPCDSQAARTAAERFRRAVADKPFTKAGGEEGEVEVTISLGICSDNGQSNAPIDSLLKRADDALYHSKANGRNRATQSEK